MKTAINRSRDITVTTTTRSDSSSFADILPVGGVQKAKNIGRKLWQTGLGINVDGTELPEDKTIGSSSAAGKFLCHVDDVEVDK